MTLYLLLGSSSSWPTKFGTIRLKAYMFIYFYLLLSKLLFIIASKISRPETPFKINDSLPVAELLNKIWEKLNLMENNQEVMKDKLLLLDL